MKKLLAGMMMLLMSIAYMSAQSKAEIKFDETTHNFGTFTEENPIVTHVFHFTNIGEAPLVIHQAIASCGCTVPKYTKEPILPGEKGTLEVTYNGAGRAYGQFKKSITLRTNGKTETIRLYIEGKMLPKADKESGKSILMY